jgi:hypothetical protein
MIMAYDINNVASTSAKISFICLTTPIWEFGNVSNNQVIRNSSYAVTIKYVQAQNELLNDYRVTLYSAVMAEQWNTGAMYGSVTDIVLTGLTNSNKYFIRATGSTVNGIVLDTGFIPFLVEYSAPFLYSVLGLENRPEEGSIRISSNIVSITGHIIPSGEPEFSNGELVNLTKGQSVVFDEGFNLNGNYLTSLAGNNFAYNEPIMILEDKNGYTVTLYYRQGLFSNSDGSDSIHTFIELVGGPELYYVIFSNHLNEFISSSDNLHIWFRRVNGLYEIKLSKI